MNPIFLCVFAPLRESIFTPLAPLTADDHASNPFIPVLATCSRRAKFSPLTNCSYSAHSWTIDIATRRRNAKHEADALRSTANEPKSRLKKHQETLDKLKKTKAKPAKLEPVKELIKANEREIRDIDSKAQSIEDAAFDLKAVNPNARTKEDTRSSAELIEIIRNKGREVQEILGQLEKL